MNNRIKVTDETTTFTMGCGLEVEIPNEVVREAVLLKIMHGAGLSSMNTDYFDLACSVKGKAKAPLSACSISEEEEPNLDAWLTNKVLEKL